MFSFDKRVLYVILAVLVVTSLASMTSGAWLNLLLTLPAVVIAITFHEYAHAWMADRLGDTTPRSQGRLTLNPLAHLDPVGSILLIFAHVGWGKPVQINPNNFTSNKSKGACEALVSFAGPAMNFIIAIILTLVSMLLTSLAPASFLYSSAGNVIGILIYVTITVNIGLGVFNLIPLPPLDGEKIFRNFLPYRALQWLDRNAYTLNLIFMVLWITGLLGVVVSPVIEVIQSGIFWLVGSILSLFL
ncbi:MAG: site-2 protease family protein [Clostridia bacterium]|nr:site-2 protease family protein [Clostridia bacterium]